MIWYQFTSDWYHLYFHQMYTDFTADNKINWNIFLIFFQKRSFDISCKLRQFAWNDIFCFLGKIRKNIISFLSAEFAQSVFKVKTPHICGSIFFLLFLRNILFWVYSLEKPWWGTSNVYRQHNFSGRHYENTPIQLYRKFHLQILNIFRWKIWYFFHISAQNIDCGYSLEPPRRGGSNEYPQSMFLSRNKKNNVYPCKPQFYYIKVGFKVVKII